MGKNVQDGQNGLYKEMPFEWKQCVRQQLILTDGKTVLTEIKQTPEKANSKVNYIFVGGEKQNETPLIWQEHELAKIDEHILKSSSRGTIRNTSGWTRRFDCGSVNLENELFAFEDFYS